MAVAVVQLLQAIHVEKQQRKFPAGAIRTPDFHVQRINQVTIICQSGKGIARCLPAQVVLQFALFGNVFHNDLVGAPAPCSPSISCALSLTFKLVPSLRGQSASTGSAGPSADWPKSCARFFRVCKNRRCDIAPNRSSRDEYPIMATSA